MKKVLSVLAVVALVFGMSAVAFGAPSVTSIESGVFVSDISYTSGDTFDVGSKLSDIDKNFKPGEKINIYLDPSKFVGTDLEFTPEKGMSARDLKSAGIEYRISSGENTQLIASHGFKEKEVNGQKVALIQLELVSNLAATEAKSFETRLTIYAQKVKQQEIDIYGEISSSETEIRTGDDYIFIGDGEIAVATDSIKSFEFDAGNNVSLFTNVIKDKKYYAVAKEEATDSDIELMKYNEEIETVYQLSTDGFSENTEVKIKSTEKFYVYDGNGKLLGTTDDRLALASKYFLATKEVDLGIDAGDKQDGSDNSEPDLPDDIIDPLPGDVNGGSDIPDTGIGMAPQIAVLAVLVGGATIAAVTMKSRKK